MANIRHLARIAVMQTLFSYEFKSSRSIEEADKILKYNLEDFAGRIQDPTFAEELLHGVLSHYDEIHKIIAEKAPEWPIEKISPIDRAILELGVFELLYSKDVPPLVAINEAIEIAKKYGNENSHKFVNGVLANVMQSHNIYVRKT